MTLAEDQLRAVFPIDSDLVQLTVESVRDELDADGALFATMRIIILDRGDDGARHVRDIKEQEVKVAPEGISSGELFAQYLEGWTAAIQVALKAASARLAAGEARQGRASVKQWMPNDFVAMDVFKLKTAKTAEQFREAYMTKARLGELID